MAAATDTLPRRGDDVREPAKGAVPGANVLHEPELAAGTQDAAHLGKRGLRAVHAAEAERDDDRVEGRGGEGQGFGTCGEEARFDARLASVAEGAFEHVGVGLDADVVDVGGEEFAVRAHARGHLQDAAGGATGD
ncbi:MAG: hypothetical protein U5Q44_10460 [Dehalococcoidia bacterium]|nr:hypothetical protein [Dehalococcoidia bacterium]